LDAEDDSGIAFLEDSYFEKDNGRYGHEAKEQSEAEDRQNR
jgi:hypothetical protein